MVQIGLYNFCIILYKLITKMMKLSLKINLTEMM